MLKTLFSYAYETRRGQLALILAITILMSFLIALGNKEKWWDNLLDPAIGLGTFLFAIFVWYRDLAQNWENSLPKRLSVRFVFDGQLVLFCRNAQLASEADIRQWGQQIGSQMCNGENLNFRPFFETRLGVPKRDERGDFYKPYFLQIFLTELPSRKNTELTEKVKEGHYLRWEQGRAGHQESAWRQHPIKLPPLDQNDAL